MTLPSSPAYMMAYFRSGPRQTDKVEQLHYAYSRDGLRWYELNHNEPVWAPSLGEGVLRDPFIQKGADGLWHMVFTIRPSNIRLGYARSRDLVHWEGEKAIPAMANFGQVANSWAPEFNFDPEQNDYMLHWSSSLGPKVNNNKIYCLRTPDWESFSEAKLLFDPGYRIIDANITCLDGKYHMFYKDEEYVYDRGKEPHPPGNKLAVSDHLEGPYVIASDFITPDFTEGPEILKLQDEETWCLFYDYWAYGKIGVMQSGNLREWSEELEAGRVHFPYRARHFTVFPVTEEELAVVINRYGVEAHYPTPVFGGVRVADRAAAGRLHDEFARRSVSVWFQAKDLEGTQLLYDEGGSRSGFALRLRAGSIEAAVASEGVGTTLTFGLKEAQSWNHAILVFNEGLLELYVNGTFAASAQAPFDWIEPHSDPGGYGARFGTDAFGDSGDLAAFGGQIRSVKLYSVPLQPADIAFIYGQECQMIGI
ncbi:LamG-like jellyroll fold domain-containing protein [Paenibacillus sp. YN15]|uniref:LamG-like jellyroll fold domain-containing protein n=1 Tax=Paenibacillus sp. YN15 TaxID=1742774 RepID=UPI000DCBF16B|nr:LamG-like jellyroll fold domain-containing protein [Paenibacillus sp. YN15]RAV06639.1 hypothetical protein DQG13_00545 [Paenibacillus sp. YN15]